MNAQKICIFSNINNDEFDLMRIITDSNKLVTISQGPVISFEISSLIFSSDNEENIITVLQIIFLQPYKTLKKTRIQFYQIKPQVWSGADYIIFAVNKLDSISLNNFFDFHKTILNMTDLSKKTPNFYVIGDLPSKELAYKMKCLFLSLSELKLLSKLEVLNKIIK